MFGDIEQAIGKAPFVIKPDEQIDQPVTGSARLAGVNNRGMRVVVEVD